MGKDLFSMRLDAELLSDIKAVADKRGMSCASVVNKILRGELNKVVPRISDEDLNKIRDILADVLEMQNSLSDKVDETKMEFNRIGCNLNQALKRGYISERKFSLTKADFSQSQLDKTTFEFRAAVDDYKIIDEKLDNLIQLIGG